MFESAFEHAATGMALVGLGGRWLRVNRSLCRITGYAEGELLARTFHDVTHPGDLDKDVSQARRLLAGEIEAYHVEKRYLRKGGSVVWVLLSCSLVRDRAGGPLYFVAQVQDIGERKALEGRLRRMATRDALTGLPNRAAFLDHLRRAAARSRRRAASVAVLFVDLDGFKAVNDGLGHGAGDAVLAEAARRLGSCVRRGDVVARLGGDEFAVLAEDIGRAEADGLAGRIVGRLGDPVGVGGSEAIVGASVGVAMEGPGREWHRGDLLRAADEAMYAAKTAGGSAHRFVA